MNGRGLYFWVAGAVVALDQAPKAAIDRLLSLHESRTLIEGVLQLTYVRNRGAAFGLFSDSSLPHQSLVLSVLGLLALTAIALYAWKLPANSRLPRTGLALIMGGALGNLLDRARLGYVIDFVDAYWGPHHWPAFNAADSAISIGVCLLVLDILLHPSAQQTAVPNPSTGRTE